MASKATLKIRVTTQRGHQTVQFTSGGKAVSFQTSGYQRTLTQQPLVGQSSLAAYWTAVIAQVQASITNTPNPP